MKYILLMGICLIALQGKVQAAFYVVVDKEGYVNIRAKPTISAKVVGRLNSKDIVSCTDFDTKELRGFCKYKNGYLHLSRLQPITELTSLRQGNLQASNLRSFKLNDSIKVTISTNNFSTSLNKVSYLDSINTFPVTKVVSLINDHSVLGTDGGVPTSEYKSIEIFWKGHSTQVLKSYFEDLYNPNIEQTKVYYDETNDRVLINAPNSDGAAAYNALLILNSDCSVSRLIEDTN